MTSHLAQPCFLQGNFKWLKMFCFSALGVTKSMSNWTNRHFCNRLYYFCAVGPVPGRPEGTAIPPSDSCQYSQWHIHIYMFCSLARRICPEYSRMRLNSRSGSVSLTSASLIRLLSHVHTLKTLRLRELGEICEKVKSTWLKVTSGHKNSTHSSSWADSQLLHSWDQLNSACCFWCSYRL